MDAWPNWGLLILRVRSMDSSPNWGLREFLGFEARVCDQCNEDPREVGLKERFYLPDTKPTRDVPLNVESCK